MRFNFCRPKDLFKILNSEVGYGILICYNNNCNVCF